jgi:magnesium-transporting ATPase (P-type)
VVCCRVSPKQKAEVVGLVKKTLGETCLSIGDGANDVSMITEAHIGVGISGKEGRQAVMASDYAIGQFRYLEELLLIHGRWSYKHIAFMICYYFYKNFLSAISQVHALPPRPSDIHVTVHSPPSLQFWFTFYNGFSGQTIVDSWHLTFYNLVFTALPGMFFAVLDRDVKKKAVRAFPELYECGLRNTDLTTVTFFSWLARGLIDSIIIFFVCATVWGQDTLAPDGMNAGMWAMGLNLFTVVVLVANAKLALYMNTWTWWQLIVFIITVFAYVAFVLLYSALVIKSSVTELYYVAVVTWTYPGMWATVFLCLALCLVRYLLCVCAAYLWQLSARCCCLPLSFLGRERLWS